MTLPLAAATPSGSDSIPGLRPRRALVSNRRLPSLAAATPMCFDFLPVELVIKIFLMLVGDDNSDRRLAPFIISAVSSKWRYTALEFGKLWSYIRIPDPGATSSLSSLADYVTLMLNRSRTAQLHIVLPWSNSRASMSFLEPVPGSTIHILGLISAQAHRWEQFEFYPPRTSLHTTALEALFLGKHMPHLSLMHIGDPAANSPMIVYPVPAIWTSYPLLRSARLNLEFSQFTRGATLTSLVDLELSSPYMVEDLWPVLELTPSLERLNLSCQEILTRYEDSDTLYPSQQYAIPRLHTLIFGTPVAPELFRLLASIVKAPQLRTLELPATMVFRADKVDPILAFMDTSGSGITHLRLTENVRSRCHKYVSSPCRDEHIWDVFLDRTRGPREYWLCPSLTNIQLRDFRLLPESGASLMCFQQSRNRALRDSRASRSTQLSIDWELSPALECRTYELFCAFHDVSISRDEWERLAPDQLRS